MSDTQKERERSFKEVNAALGWAFTQYVMEHHDFAEHLPFRAHVVFEIEGDEAYNAWSKRISRSGADPDQPVVHVIVADFDPKTARIIGRPKIKEAAKPR